MHHLMQMEEEAMQGMPDYLFLCSLAAIGLLSGIILIIFIKGRTTTENYPKYELPSQEYSPDSNLDYLVDRDYHCYCIYGEVVVSYVSLGCYS